MRDLGGGERAVREQLERELAASGVAELAIARAGFAEAADQRALRERGVVISVPKNGFAYVLDVRFAGADDTLCR